MIKLEENNNVKTEQPNNIKKAEKSNKKQRNKRNILVIIACVISLIVAYVLFRGSYLETLEIGDNYINIFWQNIKYMSITLIINFFIVYTMIYLTTNKIKTTLKDFFKAENKQVPKLPNKSISFILGILVSAFTSKFILGKILLCFNATLFGETDPVLGYDIGYFIFQKPFIELVIMYFLVAIVALSIYSAIYYIASFNIYFEGIDRQTLRKSAILKQLTKNIKIFAILIAAFVFIKTQDVGLQKFLNIKDDSNTYSLVGAGFTDATIKLWGYRILSIVIIVSIFMAIKAFYDGKIKKVITSIVIVPSYIIILLIVTIGFNIIFVNSNELDKEKKYIQANINYTKNAYGINIEEVNVENGGTITEESVSKNADLLNNVAIVSKDIVLKDLKGSQTSKGYYSYRDTKIGKYTINGKDKLVYVSPREIVSSNGTYNNKTYEYTHGYGAIITSASTTNNSGNLEHIQKSFENTDEAVKITEPRIYFGLETNDTVVTNSSTKKEFDYPNVDSSSADNAENTYNGQAGLSLNFLDRVILSIKEGNLKLALTGDVTSESKILTNRNIINRAKKIMPYLTYDENPYMVVNNEGKLIWVLDAYTTSNEYPYSQRTILNQNSVAKTEINYIRNSVKILIDSYDGTMKFYITDRTDPIAMAYRNIYPDLFEDLEETIPEDISSHFVYPEYLYKIQAEVLKRYHNIQPDVLYRNDDVWDIATHNTGKVLTKTGTEIEPYYTMLKTKDSESSTLGLVIPYTPYDKQNVISYLVGTYDENGKARLTTYKFPDDSNVLGPMQLDTQIEQDETISKDIESLNVNGTKITKNMVIVPIDDTLLYIEPIYQQYINEENALPTLKKVVVASGNKVAIGNNFKEALTNLVSRYAVDIEVENTDSVEDLVTAIVKANKNLQTSTNNNDWEMVGKDMKKLQDLINKLEVVKKEEDEKQNEILNQTKNNTVDNTVSNNNSVQ